MSAEWTQEWGREQLRSLCIDWRDCTKCALHESRRQIVFGNGHPTADLMFIGEGPGETEDRTGETFSGKSGDLLNLIFTAAKIKRERVFTANLIMCRPPDNRDPSRAEREACLERLHQQIYLVDPMLIIPVGKPAMKALMKGGWTSILEEQGKIGWMKVPGRYMDEILYPAMPIIHPAFILREDRISRETKNWERGGYAHQTVEHLRRAKDIVDILKAKYSPVRQRLRIVD